MKRQLPAGWASSDLSLITAINPSTPIDHLNDQVPVSFVPMAAVEAMSGRMDASRTRPWRVLKKGFTRFQEGDVVLAKITPSMENGKVAIAANLAGGLGAGTTELHVFRPESGVRTRYVLFYLLHDDFRRRAKARMTGTAGQLRVPTAFLEEERVPVAPNPEQERIINSIDSYLPRLDAAVASLERAQARLKAYRASALKAAVEGRLVPTEAELARAEQRDYEPAQVLLKRILAERRRRWEETELARLTAGGTTPKNDKWKAKYREPVAPDVRALPRLPEGWCWARLDQVSEVQLGQQRSPEHAEAKDQLPYIRAANITWSGLELTDVKRMGFSNPERYRLAAGDVLLSEASGSPMEAGKPAIWRGEIPGACYQKTLLRVRPINSSEVLPEFLRLIFLRDCLTGKFARLAPGVGIVHLTAERMLPWPVPLAPIREQRRLVDEMERLESLRTATVGIAVHEVARSRRLRQSILKWAFEGKLVDQDPNDEPAEKLLERIRAQRATADAAKPKRVPPTRSHRPGGTIGSRTGQVRRVSRAQ